MLWEPLSAGLSLGLLGPEPLQTPHTAHRAPQGLAGFPRHHLPPGHRCCGGHKDESWTLHGTTGMPWHRKPISVLPEGVRRQRHPSTGALLPMLWGRAGAAARVTTTFPGTPGSITGRPRGHANGRQQRREWEGSAGGCWLNWNKAWRPAAVPALGTLTPRAGEGTRGRLCRAAPQPLGRSRGGAEQDGPHHGAGRRPQVGVREPRARQIQFFGAGFWVIPSVKEGRCLGVS